LAPGPNVIKLFTDVIYEWPKQFVPRTPFQPGLMFVIKVGAYPSEAAFRCSTQLVAQPKTWLENPTRAKLASSLLRTFLNQVYKIFITLALVVNFISHWQLAKIS
jgi:hypothetical protein